MKLPFTFDELAATARADPEALARDEAFWGRVAALYDRDPSFVQLNYGFYHPALLPVVEAEVAAVRAINRRGSHFKVLESPGILEAARVEVAAVAGVDSETVALTRSSSESINQVIQGLRLQAGDEVIASNMDYVALEQALDQRANEDGLVVRRVEVPRDPRADVVPLFRALVGPRTKLIVVTHVIHTTGRVLPVAELCAIAREAGVPVFVDAAHAFAQVPTPVRDWGCDYFCASLHKWLGAPLGNGLLVVRRDRIGSLKPLYGDTSHAETDIRRFERLGNRQDAALVGLKEAIRWHQALTAPVKAARLLYLRDRWTQAVASRPGISLHSPGIDLARSVIATVSVEGISAADLMAQLGERGLYASVQTMPWGQGVRIVPGLPTSVDEIDRLAAALTEIAR